MRHCGWVYLAKCLFDAPSFLFLCFATKKKETKQRKRKREGLTSLSICHERGGKKSEERFLTSNEELVTSNFVLIHPAEEDDSSVILNSIQDPRFFRHSGPWIPGHARNDTRSSNGSVWKKFILILGLFLLGGLLLQAGVLDEYRLHQAQVLQQKGHYLQALKAYRKLPRKSAAERYNMANLYYRMGRFDEALALYRTVEAPTLQGRKLYNMGNCYAVKGNWQKALRFYRAALKFAPQDPDLRYNLKKAEARVRQMELEASLLKLRQKAQKKVCKLERLPLGVRRGFYEGSIEFLSDFEGNDTLKEARYSETLLKRNNQARSTGKRGLGKEASRRNREENRTVVKGKEHPFGLEEVRYRRQLQEKTLKSLLVPMTEPKKSEE